jgi:hypothetical protein
MVTTAIATTLIAKLGHPPSGIMTATRIGLD